jgi:DNA modification methylase
MEFKINTIYNEDCFQTMKQMPKIIDVVLTSPPYNTARTGTNQRAFDNYENRYDIHLDNKTDDEYLDWSVQLFNLYDKVLKVNGCVLYNISYSSENTDLIWKFVAKPILQLPILLFGRKIVQYLTMLVQTN